MNAHTCIYINRQACMSPAIVLNSNESVLYRAVLKYYIDTAHVDTFTAYPKLQ